MPGGRRSGREPPHRAFEVRIARDYDSLLFMRDRRESFATANPVRLSGRGRTCRGEWVTDRESAFVKRTRWHPRRELHLLGTNRQTGRVVVATDELAVHSLSSPWSRTGPRPQVLQPGQGQA